jgi:hypothetical protein
MPTKPAFLLPPISGTIYPPDINFIEWEAPAGMKINLTISFK